MTGPRAWTITVAAAMAIVGTLSGVGAEEKLTDLHDVAVGMTAQQLPAYGYRDFTCAGKTIASWDDWASCPAGGPDGLRAVRFAYDQPGGETKVAGHPVYLTAYFDASGRLARLEIVTDDHATRFLHKKAYMLARQAKAHYGEDGWTCATIPLSADEEPIGPLEINETCTKASPQRRLQLSTRLFHRKGGTPRDFVSETRISIAMAPAATK